MPSEFRFLVFSPKEAAQALATFARKRGRKLPDGYLNYAVPGPGTPPSGRLFVTPDEGKDLESAFAAEEVVAALILFALDNKIPLPRSGEKVLEALRLSGSDLFALRIGMFPLPDSPASDKKTAEPAASKS
ncbi:MAG: hypothetical protein NXI19_02820 [Alphaproteobacteria bacterium]|nr:hypothetical protein [Alphaproteobacteria bacterium]